jgi:uncharacterized damage-inducible protein DinB
VVPPFVLREPQDERTEMAIMGKLELIRSLFEYNQYGNEYLLAETERLSAEEFSKDRGASWGSIEANLGHVTGAQVVWVSRWDTGKVPQKLIDVLEDVQGHKAISEAFSRSHADLKAFADRVTEEEVNSILEYESNDGSPQRLPLWLLMVHLMNHGTHHRSEVCMALTAMGHEVKELDYHYFEMERERLAADDADGGREGRHG